MQKPCLNINLKYLKRKKEMQVSAASRLHHIHSGQGRLNQATTGCKCKGRLLLLSLNAAQTNNQNEASCDLKSQSKNAARHSLILSVQIKPTYHSL